MTLSFWKLLTTQNIGIDGKSNRKEASGACGKAIRSK